MAPPHAVVSEYKGSVRMESIRGYILTSSKNVCSWKRALIHMDLAITSGVIGVILCSRSISEADNIQWHAKEVRTQRFVVTWDKGGFSAKDRDGGVVPQ